MAVKRRPVVGLLVNGEPTAEVAARWIVSIVSVEEQVEPMINIPSKHLTTITGVPISTVPVRSTATGVRIVWSARRVMSNPSRPAEP
jgi:hypothetical protein